MQDFRKTDFTFRHFMPTEIFSGRNCVTENGARLQELGKHALIVTGKSSLRNGALADVEKALEDNGQDYTVYDRVLPNPTVACVREAIALLKSAGADFIVAIGGGSPMDAAKAVATLAVQDRADEEIFAGGYAAEALPTAHIPTTAGTGSEVTPYAILTNDEKQTKTSITSPAMFPRFAFLDGKYMRTLPWNVTVNTALDALSHAVEGMLSRQATPVSDVLARASMRPLFMTLRTFTKEREISLDERDALLYHSMLAGMTIAQSGTTAVHGMGYYLTYFYGIEHGRANGLLLGETLKLCEEKGLPEACEICTACGVRDAEEFSSVLSGVLGGREWIPRERLEDFSARAAENKNIKKSKYEPTEREIKRIYFESIPHK